jgi:hypothetical protein
MFALEVVIVAVIGICLLFLFWPPIVTLPFVALRWFRSLRNPTPEMATTGLILLVTVGFLVVVGGMTYLSYVFRA